MYWRCFCQKWICTGAASAAVVMLAQPAEGVVPEYGILDLGTLGGTRSEAHAVNSFGQTAGSSKRPRKMGPT